MKTSIPGFGPTQPPSCRDTGEYFPGSMRLGRQPGQSPWLISNLMPKILIYLRIIHLTKFSTRFENYPAHLQEVYVVIVYMQPLVSSLSAGDCLVHRLRKNFLNRCTGQSPAESDDTRGCIYTITT